MNFLSLFKGLLGGEGVAKSVADYVGKKAEIKAEAQKRQDDLQAALQTKKLEQISQSENYEQAWNLAQIQNSGWKDEFWTIVLASPFIGCFLPFFQKYVLEGFAIIEKTPNWYRYFVGIAISAAFGYSQLNKAWKWWNTP